MTRPYTSFQYLWPPRPAGDPILPFMIPSFESRGWWAQCKREGTCTIMFVSPERCSRGRRIVTSMNRHKDDHKQWSVTEDSCGPMMDLPGTKWWVFVAELLHSKVKEKFEDRKLKDILYVHDVLVADGVQLVGVTLEDRLALLDQTFRGGRDTAFHRAITDNFWVAKTMKPGTDYARVFQGMTHPMDEGLVFKDPKARLVACDNHIANNGSAKVRRNMPGDRRLRTS